MRRIKQAVGGQRENLLAHRAVHRRWVALLEVGAAAAADQQAIAGERHRAVIEDKSEAAGGVARRRAHHQPPPAESDDIVLHQIAVGSGNAARLRHHDLTAGALLHQRGPGDVIGVDMGFQRGDEVEAEFGDERRVAPHLLENRVDQHRGAALAVAQQIGVGRGLRIEQLAKDQHVISA
jgi:hypothetical protein